MYSSVGILVMNPKLAKLQTKPFWERRALFGLFCDASANLQQEKMRWVENWRKVVAEVEGEEEEEKEEEEEEE